MNLPVTPRQKSFDIPVIANRRGQEIMSRANSRPFTIRIHRQVCVIIPWVVSDFMA